MQYIPDDTLKAIQKHFHALIRKRAGALIDKHNITLPELAPLLAGDAPINHLGQSGDWFKIDGWYGGFNYWLEGEGSGARLVTESWCRVVQGSGQQHHITPEGSILIENEIV